jgi:2'-5' RNA ligase
MKNTISSIPGYHLNEYLVVLTPHEDLRQKIVQLKKEFSAKYEGTLAMGLKPHMAILRFSQLEMMEERILNRMHATAMGFPPFKIELSGYGSFPTHTIYIKVDTKIPVQLLQKQLRGFQRLLKPDSDHKPHFMDEPHIAIARKLLPWQYEQGWLEYQQRHFTGRFVADGMLILKRKEGEKNFQALQRFDFENLPVHTRQGELFI